MSAVDAQMYWAFALTNFVDALLLVLGARGRMPPRTAAVLHITIVLTLVVFVLLISGTHAVLVYVSTSLLAPLAVIALEYVAMASGCVAFIISLERDLATLVEDERKLHKR